MFTYNRIDVHSFANFLVIVREYVYVYKDAWHSRFTVTLRVVSRALLKKCPKNARGY